jgi:hypothetical protein
MKMILPTLLVVALVVSCAKKAVPNTTINTPSTTNTTIINNDGTATTIPPTAIKRMANLNAMVVIDGNGRIVTPKDKLPVEDNIHPDYSTIARAFTPAQKANLTLRYKTIPPKIIYVPEVFTSKSLKGTYIIYKKKFWYWKKEDGLFYLDETYYK